MIGAAIALGTVIFTAGDASQRLSSHGERIGSIEARVAHNEGTLGDMRVTLATLAVQMEDVQRTVHRVDGSPVPRAPSR